MAYHYHFLNNSLFDVMNTPVVNKMAKQDSDCITLDLFSEIRRVGRPKTNPLSREQQIRINKRNQLKRDKSCGLKRVELKLHADLVQQLEDLASTRNVNRSELIVTILQDYFNVKK
ncbi:LexA regulated protein [Aggregatibacter segnis ATCC 33393]|uniref:LexA regulated protein n=2 Tax=Aggregatibacter segnis TaxID=739 RepID=E6KWU5_9PAST|nr:LexA regulated protein [Aggregatibacter segnis ATCC 33393]